ncbi:hypothetical protein D4764_04G0001510 [Takifugu flavidus]|uniref:Uncharacterized protein n=1 Tax=Takifugu flavidus TaxID=433684 RepID=A0A5C6N1P8_9TELE|nr:hypothetical protein D4764_04G0001510 [Takifugu flavidus]
MEKSAHQNTKEELEIAKLQIKIEDEKSSPTHSRVSRIKERLAALETDYCMEKSAHQKTKEELEIAKLHHKMHNEREMSDLRTKMENCTALLEASLKAKASLEEKLSDMDTVYAKRDEKYVSLINKYIVEAHNSKAKLKNHISKCNEPVQKKVRSWIKKNILREPSDAPHNIEEPPHLYPDDWRLPGIPDQ